MGIYIMYMINNLFPILCFQPMIRRFEYIGVLVASKTHTTSDGVGLGISVKHSLIKRSELSKCNENIQQEIWTIES